MRRQVREQDAIGCRRRPAPDRGTETGTIAISGLSGSALCMSKYVRSAPEHTASVTSLTVAPRLADRLERASSYDCAANRREPEIRTLNMVGGA